MSPHLIHTTLNEFAGYLNTMSGNVSSITVKVLDARGRIAQRICTDVNNGAYHLKVKMKDLSEGTYVLNAFSGDIFLKAMKFKIE
jgi:hypothetical protein